MDDNGLVHGLLAGWTSYRIVGPGMGPVDHATATIMARKLKNVVPMNTLWLLNAVVGANEHQL